MFETLETQWLSGAPRGTPRYARTKYLVTDSPSEVSNAQHALTPSAAGPSIGGGDPSRPLGNGGATDEAPTKDNRDVSAAVAPVPGDTPLGGQAAPAPAPISLPADGDVRAAQQVKRLSVAQVPAAPQARASVRAVRPAPAPRTRQVRPEPEESAPRKSSKKIEKAEPRHEESGPPKDFLRMSMEKAVSDGERRKKASSDSGRKKKADYDPLNGEL